MVMVVPIIMHLLFIYPLTYSCLIYVFHGWLFLCKEGMAGTLKCNTG